MTWSLSTILTELHGDIEHRLKTSRTSFGHPGTKGDASEEVWRSVLETYLPRRYQVAKAHIVDSQGTFSEQIDVTIFDRQYSPFIFQYEGQAVVPAESVYAVFEAKQTCNSSIITYAQKKVASVRRLHRTSLPIPHAGGIYPAKQLNPIIGGLLTLDSDWSPPMGDSLKKALNEGEKEGQLDLGCIAQHGYFSRETHIDDYQIYTGTKAATAFLFKLISDLQFNGTVPMIDVQAYAQWL